MASLGVRAASDRINWPMTPGSEMFNFLNVHAFTLVKCSRLLSWTCLKAGSVPSRRACAFIMGGLWGFIDTCLLLSSITIENGLYFSLSYPNVLFLTNASDRSLLGKLYQVVAGRLFCCLRQDILKCIYICHWTSCGFSTELNAQD